MCILTAHNSCCNGITSYIDQCELTTQVPVLPCTHAHLEWFTKMAEVMLCLPRDHTLLACIYICTQMQMQVQAKHQNFYYGLVPGGMGRGTQQSFICGGSAPRSKPLPICPLLHYMCEPAWFHTFTLLLLCLLLLLRSL